MKLRPQVKYPQLGTTLIIRLLFIFCILLLQVGITYYQSFQTLALAILLFVIIKNRPSIVNLASILFFISVFITFLSITAFNVPLAVSENSENIFITIIGVVGYAIIIISIPNIVFKSPENMLHFFSFVSTVTLVIIASLIFITDLSIIPFLTRETLVLQNTTLITNNTTMERLLEDFAYLEGNGLNANLDLFYGEQSFLSVVIFACITSKLISNRLLQTINLRRQEQIHGANKEGQLLSFTDNLQSLVIFVGLASMVYIRSFSSFFYALVVCATFFLSAKHGHFNLKLTHTKLLVISILFVLLGGVVWSAFDFYFYRLTNVSESNSFEQRFSSIFDFGFQEYLVGISDASKIPMHGFQNGILYIIGISGIGGICWLAFLLYRSYILARSVRLSLLALACILGIFSQNGGILSPNKIILLSLVLIPLSCANRIRLPK